ncbi:SIS domain-containing protein [Maledivibacter halophilus]|nr:SIS domain-containing protein [Maledivibacter halophilus]
MNTIDSILKRIKETQKSNIKEASNLMAKAVKDNNMLHFFGCGHSLMLCEEVFYRAGGLACVNPIFDTALMVQHGAIKSSMVEKQEGYVKWVLDRYELKKREVITIFSTSGRNPVPIDAALSCKEKGLKVIGVTSVEYSEKSKSRHSSGKHLCDVCDVVIDNCIGYGDALLDYGNFEAVPGSTIAGSFIINSVIADVIEKVKKSGMIPPILISGNVDGGSEHNRNILEKYMGKVKHL